MVYSILLICTMFYVGQAHFDYLIKISRSKYPHHPTGAGIALGFTALVCIVHAVLIRFNLVELSIIYYTCFAIRANIYDLILNLLRGKDFYYIGLPDKDDAVWDTFLLSLPYSYVTQYVFKGGLLAIAMFLLIHYNIIKL